MYAIRSYYALISTRPGVSRSWVSHVVKPACQCASKAARSWISLATPSTAIRNGRWSTRPVEPWNESATLGLCRIWATVVLFDDGLAWEAALRRKRAGHLASKMRFAAAQIDAYLADDLWLRNARHANAMAARLQAGLAQVPGVEIVGPAAANILFCKLPKPLIDGLLAEGFAFYHDRWAPGVVRLVCAFATEASEVDAFVAAAARLAA